MANNKITPEPYSYNGFDKLRTELEGKISALEAKNAAKFESQTAKIEGMVPRHVVYWALPLILGVIGSILFYSFTLMSQQAEKDDIVKDRVLVLETKLLQIKTK